MNYDENIMALMDERVLELMRIKKFMGINVLSKNDFYQNPHTGIVEDVHVTFGEKIAYIEGEIRGLNYNLCKNYE